MAIKRLRRMKDGVIFGYNPKMAQVLGMEVVVCDEHNNVLESVGEEGQLGVYGRKYVNPKNVADKPGEPTGVLDVPPKSDLDAALEGIDDVVDHSDLG